jgi:predicted phosphohydrolase
MIFGQGAFSLVIYVPFLDFNPILMRVWGSGNNMLLAGNHDLWWKNGCKNVQIRNHILVLLNVTSGLNMYLHLII